MDFSVHICTDILIAHIFGIGRDIHKLVMCSFVNKQLRKQIMQILEDTETGDITTGLSISKLFDQGCRAFRLKFGGASTYHYAVNNTQFRTFNYHHDGGLGIRSLQIILYDGRILYLSMDDNDNDIRCTSVTSISCCYKQIDEIPEIKLITQFNIGVYKLLPMKTRTQII